MKFSLSNKRAAIGNDITVKINAEGSEKIKKVSVVLDSRSLAKDNLSPMEVEYTGVYPSKGSAGPGRKHILKVTAVDNSNKSHTASRRWQDRK